MTPPEPRYRVFLTDEATVVERGERVRVWFVRFGDGWVRAQEHPDAEVEEVSSIRGDESCPPGTIWQRSVELLLPAGALLRCIVSRPRQEDLSAMDYLRRGAVAKGRTVSTSYHRVIGNYRLEGVKQVRAGG